MTYGQIVSTGAVISSVTGVVWHIVNLCQGFVIIYTAPKFDLDYFRNLDAKSIHTTAMCPDRLISDYTKTFPWQLCIHGSRIKYRQLEELKQVITYSSTMCSDHMSKNKSASMLPYYQQIYSIFMVILAEYINYINIQFTHLWRHFFSRFKSKPSARDYQNEPDVLFGKYTLFLQTFVHKIIRSY